MKTTETTETTASERVLMEIDEERSGESSVVKSWGGEEQGRKAEQSGQAWSSRR